MNFRVSFLVRFLLVVDDFPRFAQNLWLIWRFYHGRIVQFIENIYCRISRIVSMCALNSEPGLRRISTSLPPWIIKFLVYVLIQLLWIQPRRRGKGLRPPEEPWTRDLRAADLQADWFVHSMMITSDSAVVVMEFINSLLRNTIKHFMKIFIFKNLYHRT